ncbi:glycosyltransferase family 9 protein [Bordetella genomosp. 9]|uniref:Glycosyl transferase n=1 Tax=Bordetella genomosp. 9 TaxID=1416803 RepID=A0A1W6YWL9_9BORD|nr:glycosyltransferase family 9 protein [Bordetella genomosp. 9]ARP85456.1 hypothetical protein CAL13_03920 [Bordetella genomosp. 9]
MSGPPPVAALSGVARIAVLRANAIGDFILALPALQALRDTYPEARITLLGCQWHADFLAARPGPVDEVVVLPPIPGITAPAGEPVREAPIRQVLDQLRQRNFDIALQLHGGGRYSNPFVLALGARVTAGMRTLDAAPLDRDYAYIPAVHDLMPRAMLLRDCVALAGAHGAMVEPRLHPRAADREECERRLPSLREPFAILQPGATDPRRRWDAARFAAVGDALAARGAQVIVNGSAGEAPITAAVCRSMRAPAIDAAGRLSPGGLCALLERAHVLVSNDTGPAHLARALNRPAVTIYWIGNLHSYGPLTARNQGLAVSYRVHCPVCGLSCIDHRCGHDASFVNDVPADAVIEQACRLYDADAAFAA